MERSRLGRNRSLSISFFPLCHDGFPFLPLNARRVAMGGKVPGRFFGVFFNLFFFFCFSSQSPCVRAVLIVFFLYFFLFSKKFLGVVKTVTKSTSLGCS